MRTDSRKLNFAIEFAKHLIHNSHRNAIKSHTEHIFLNSIYKFLIESLLKECVFNVK